MIRVASTARPAPKPAATRRFDEAAWPTDRTVVRFVKQSGSDANGRQHFTALWWEGEQRRGQVFHGSLEEHLRRAWREGVVPELVDAIGTSFGRAA